jgi:hypothetical protein
VVSGKIEVRFNDQEPYEVFTCGYLKVEMNQFYELHNTSDQDAMIFFTRTDSA